MLCGIFFLFKKNVCNVLINVDLFFVSRTYNFQQHVEETSTIIGGMLCRHPALTLLRSSRHSATTKVQLRANT